MFTPGGTTTVNHRRVRLLSVGVALVAAVGWTSRPADARAGELAPITRQATAEVEASVSARQRLQSMDLANGITRLVADLSSEYRLPVPYALVLLDYYGRELELGIAAGDQVRLAQATADLQQTWDRFEDTVLERDAVDEARRFTDSVAQLVDARAPGDFVAPTRAELAAVDALKRLFKL